jgi:His-Xaa-Ser repeat protein HxsA
MGHHRTTRPRTVWFRAALIAGASLGLAGCNTAEGFGTDMSNSWHWITGSGSSSSDSSSATTNSSHAASTPTAGTGSSTASAAATSKPHAISGSTDPSGLSRAKIREAQTKLHDDGYYKGKIDGVIGPETRSAVMAFQTKAGIPANGELDPATLTSLNSSKM